jgi:hypothetical protein
MRPAVALVTPDYEVDSREHKTRARIYRPGNGDPTHLTTAGEASILFVGVIANLPKAGCEHDPFIEFFNTKLLSS